MSCGGKYRRFLTPYKRNFVAARQGYNCALCHQRLGASFEIDHVCPIWRCRQKGMSSEEANALSNLVAVHPACHADKSAQEARLLYDVNEERETGISRFFNPQSLSFLPPAKPPPADIRLPKQKKNKES